MKRVSVIVIASVIGLAAIWYYFSLRVPADIAVKSDNDLTVQWITLAIAVTSLLTAMIGLIQKVIELRSAKERS